MGEFFFCACVSNEFPTVRYVLLSIQKDVKYEKKTEHVFSEYAHGICFYILVISSMSWCLVPGGEHALLLTMWSALFVFICVFNLGSILEMGIAGWGTG